MRKARATILEACKRNKVFFLNGANANNIVDMIKEGVMVVAGGTPATAEAGRKFTKRTMP
jgi:hypothetical protein